jgi:hypothetical protein
MPDLRQIGALNLDVLVACGNVTVCDEALQLAGHGVWSFHHGDPLINRGGPPGYWESMENWPETGSILKILDSDTDKCRTISKSFSCTDRMSVRDNRNNYFWKAPTMLVRALRELHTFGSDEFRLQIEKSNDVPLFYSNKIRVPPTNLELLKHVARKILEKTKLLFYEKFFFDQWILMYDVRETLSTSLWRYKKIFPPRDRFWADPHVVAYDDKLYIFFEDYPYETEKGHISVLEVSPDGSFGEPRVVLDRKYHLSYPFVFEFNGDHFMVPETMSNRTIELYKSQEFPDRWEFQHNLIDNIDAVDATILEHENRWWLFANVVETAGTSSWDELFLFSAENPLSDKWIPHPMNPIVSDCKSSRPAGRIFRIGGKLFRPSQNSSHHYGYGFNIVEIEKLTMDDYAERIVSRVLPNWDKNISGTHTFSREGSLHVIDALHRRSRFTWFDS